MTNEQVAILYAAQKLIEAELKDRTFQPGLALDVSGESITITFGKGTKVSRSKGEDGQGNIWKKATQNLYGYAVWVFFLRRLALFNQAGHIRRLIMEAWQEALRTGAKVETELSEVDPELANFVEELKAQPGPKRKESTPRLVESGAQPTFTFG